ncbi:DUF2797 domain-containing protein [uncultured Porticoccus sp.]|uniref:DUF2797 domain-containing protein n=1 Tax=uncultured Porticoccus sp. TaxID=1256050 RepID=UPI0030D8CB96|tara:strand:- start:5593 stop:6420 length:828 start_codon:yes stop_codon:yes gene_type:complete
MPDYSGHLKKMRVALAGGPVQYGLPLDDEYLPLNDLLGKTLRIQYSGTIHCIHCGRRSNKSFSQGYCYPCFTRLAQCDSCIVSPEKCHYFEGTCREPEWGQQHCMVDHIVYLANSSGVKVGITRESQLPTRWIDQGALQALPIMRVKTRQQSGLVEDVLRQHVADKTNWRTMLKGEIVLADLPAIRDALFDRTEKQLTVLEDRFGLQALQRLDDVAPMNIDYPVLEYPTKVTSFNLDKVPSLEGTLLGIKGQYLIFDSGVINIRKYTAYHVEVTH